MSRGAFIENEAAYEAAISRNIRMNARKTRRANWMKLDGAERVNDFLFRMGEFEDAFDPETGNFVALHPVVRASLGDFYDAMFKNVGDWGGLTEKQNAAVIAMIARSEVKVAEWAKARAEALRTDIDRSGWVGAVGERRVFELTIRRVIELDGTYGLSYINLCNDADGNVIVYKGSNCLGDKGDVVRVKATIKEHGERDGVRQTKIARPAEVK